MDDSNRTARVAMMWTPALKEAVREVAGPGGMTDWIIDAVQTKLEGEVPSGPPAEIYLLEKASPDEERVLAEAAASPTVVKKRERIEEPVAPPEKPVSVPIEEALEPPKIAKDRDDLFARVMAKAGNPEELEKNKDKFSTASE